MAEDKGPKGSGSDSTPATNQISAPSISLPKGGGAIRGMGEKFAANPVTGTGSMTIPIATSPGRSGFGPQLSLSYDSGAGNGPFGLGWNLSLPAITRKTDKGLPQYQDADESDGFVLSGAEDLVPEFEKDANGKWIMEGGKHVIYDKPRTVDGITYRIRRYRPRIEGLFARIERWSNIEKPDEVFWRSISIDNVTSWYGKTEESRIFDPSTRTHVFSWLICESYDDKGNAIRYEYKAEDSVGVDLSSAHEANRTETTRSAHRYLKRIKYGNKTPRKPNEVLAQRTDWLFEAVFDYGEHYTEDAQGQPITVLIKDDQRPWPVRQDPFSTYRAGFEVRTYRLCQRVLMFHHFPELGSNDCLVRATHFTYRQALIASFITSATQSGYIRQSDGTYLKKSLPSVECEYSEAIIDETVREVDAASLENLPQGLDGSAYQWVDLDGEGLSGILTEQAGAWFYKRNQSALPVADKAGKLVTIARFSPLETLATMPSPARLSGGQQLMDLAGDGQLDVVEFDGPTPGFFERTPEDEWDTLTAFTSLPNIAWRYPHLKFIDLTGDGHADILITEDDAFTWYPSLAEAGFGPGKKVRQAIDEEQGPRLVFADGTQSIYLADMSGDGLTDLVRIRNGDVCYWPNIGYGRFGAKVTMGNAPLFDYPDQFDQRRIRLADIDGSGVVDMLYLSATGVHLYFNQSGNTWSARRTINTFPRIDNLSSVTTVDLLGNGTACLVWSSPLSGDARSPMRYIELMGGNKPHLLVKTRNNLGAETEVSYVSSTKFYLADRLAGNPWITRLPFPVHCVEKVTVRDKWRQTEFSTTYSYHHGYFDGVEREFRGFGRVEQVDTESYGTFLQGNIASPYITDDHTLYQPPMKSVTWYHTGFASERDRILSTFEQEYFKVPGFAEHQLPQPTLMAGDLTADEWREAVRACKGMVLRQEVFELDVDALEQGKHKPVRLFTTAYHNNNIQCLQPQDLNRHAVFLVTESEAISYHYELDLTDNGLTPDPRIAHTLNLRVDSYGHALQSVAVAYPRQGAYTDPTNILTPEQRTLIQTVQRERHLAYTETHYTDELPDDPDQHRLPVPCEVLTYELTGADGTRGFTPSTGRYFTLDDLRSFALSDTLPGQGAKSVTKRQYHQQPLNDSAHKRIVEWVRMLYFKDDLSGPQPFGTHAWLCLPYETYKLALTRNLLDAVFGSKLTADVVTQLNTPSRSGYVAGTVIDASLTDQYWIRSGIAGFATDAKDHFYLPEEYTDPFNNKTRLAYDGKYDLFIQSSTDAHGNSTSVERFDYRVLTPCEMLDINGNHTEVYFDVLGMVVASAVKGKRINRKWEGDDLIGFDDARANPSPTEVVNFCTSSTFSQTQARTWLGHATARFVYHFGETRDAQGRVTAWADRPAGACGILREIHFNSPGGAGSSLQIGLECSDGSGNVLMKKMQAEPNPITDQERWIINGLTVLNNKGKTVKQYEPAFSDRFGCEMPQANGVTPIMYYDSAGRVIRTELPDGTLSRVEFSPWHVRTFDQNDTVKESRWYRERLTAAERNEPLFQPGASAQEQAETQAVEALAAVANTQDKRAARRAVDHADTPAQTHLDSLGREVISIAHNRTNGIDEKYVTFTKLDAEGKPLWIRDAKNNLVMQYIAPAKANNDPSNAMPSGSVPCYDIAGNLLYQHSMDAGERWMLMDAAGKPMLAWDVNETPQGNATIRENRHYLTDYDPLHRPTAQWLKINNGPSVMVERYEYQDGVTNDVNNLNGQLIRHYDSSGLVETVRRDFKDNVQEIHRTLTRDATVAVVNWDVADDTALNGLLEQETFVQLTEHDALNRMTRLYNWHRQAQNRVAIYLPSYNRRGLLEAEGLVMRATGYDPTTGTHTQAIVEIRYDVKGQKEYLKLGNGTLTQYDYDPLTFRLRQLRTTRPANANDFPQLRSNLTNPNVIQQLLYTYDPVGNITEVEDQAYKPVFFDNGIAEPKSLYEYDALYRLILATGRETAQGGDSALNGDEPAIGSGFPVNDQTLRRYEQIYKYDQVGNFVTMQHRVPTDTAAGWTRSYDTHLDSNRLHRTWYGAPDWDHAATAQRTEYGYDTHGNMLNVANVTPGQQLQWDHRDMIKSLDLVGGGIAHYQYDAGKQRTRKVIVNRSGVKQWERIYLGSYELYRRIVAGAVVEEIESHHLFEGELRVLLVDDVITASGIANPRPDGLSVKKQTLFRYQYSNHLGSACLELDDKVAIISYEEYHPYGTSAYRAMKSGIEAPPKRYRYTGMERDEESGLNYHEARYYAPWLNRWITCDPLNLSDGPNLYLYVQCNPVKGRDPRGTNTWVEDVPNLKQGLARLQHYADNPEDRFGSNQAGREFGLVRDLGSNKLSIVQGGSNYVIPRPGTIMEGHTHWDQNAMPSGAEGDLDYIARNRLPRHEIRAPASEGVSRTVITRSLFRDRLTVRGYEAGLETRRDSYDVSSYGNTNPPPGGAAPRMLSSRQFPGGTLQSRISVGIQNAASRVRGAVSSGIRSAAQTVRNLPGRVSAAVGNAANTVRSAASSAVQAIRNNPRAALVGAAGTAGGTLARAFIPGADLALDSAATVGVRNTVSLAARALAPVAVVAAGAVAGYVVGDAVERYVTRETGSRTAGVVVGTGAGVLAGAAAGAAVGAAIGALGFGIGAVPGAIIGGAAGAVAGFIGAYW